MRRATAFAALALAPIVLAGLPLLVWFASVALAPGGSSAAPLAADGLTCTVRAGACVGAEVEVFRMSNNANAHAGTPAGAPTYGYRVCCAADGLGTLCSGTHDTVLALSGASNAHVATSVGGAYTTEVCLSVATGTVSCTYASDCGASACLATISGSTNAHVADCDGTDDYATKVCCGLSELDCSAGVDTDGDGFNNNVECYLPTDPGDNCSNQPGVHDAWPLDINMNKVITVVGDVLPYSGRIGAHGSPSPSPTWRQRLDINMDNYITVVGDVLKFSGKIGQSCT
jgi:hypothetical protein